MGHNPDAGGQALMHVSPGCSGAGNQRELTDSGDPGADSQGSDMS